MEYKIGDHVTVASFPNGYKVLEVTEKSQEFDGAKIVEGKLLMYNGVLLEGEYIGGLMWVYESQIVHVEVKGGS